MTYDYYSQDNGHLGERLDCAWNVYCVGENENERIAALEFMIHLFDIREVSDDEDALNDVLVELMMKRIEYRCDNPYFIPCLESGPYDFEVNEGQEIPATPIYQSSSRADINSAFYGGELLDVVDDYKGLDQKHGITYLSEEEREDYRLDIHKGQLQRGGTTFDSSTEEAHGKPGYVAFTLSSTGDLSAFSHHQHKVVDGRSLSHSSMNAGRPVLAAGEMKISNGKLEAINTYSGHYTPSLYSVARFLKYLEGRGMDISNTKVQLYRSTETIGIKGKGVKVPGDDKPWYEVSACDVVAKIYGVEGLEQGLEGILKANMNSIQEYLQSDKTKLYRDVLRRSSTREKCKLAEDFLGEMRLLTDMLKNTTSFDQYREIVREIKQVIKTTDERYQEINSRGEGRLSEQFQKMKDQIEQIADRVEEKGSEREERLSSYRGLY